MNGWLWWTHWMLAGLQPEHSYYAKLWDNQKKKLCPALSGYLERRRDHGESHRNWRVPYTRAYHSWCDLEGLHFTAGCEHPSGLVWWADLAEYPQRSWISRNPGMVRTWTAPHLLDSMIYYLTSGVFCYAKRSTKQTIYAGIQENGCRNHEKRTSEYLCSNAGIWN